MHLFAFVSHVFEFLAGISYPLSCFAHSGCPENLADRFNFFFHLIFGVYVIFGFCKLVVGRKKVKVGPKKAVQWLQIFAISFFTAEWVPISGLQIIYGDFPAKECHNY